MNEKKPKVILTDQESAIAGAISRALPGTRHRFCLWHITRNATKNLGSIYNAHNGFKSDFNNCLYGCESIEDFEFTWDGMLEKYGLRDNKWLMGLYGKKEKWAAVYTHNVFYASMYTTQRSESINAYFDGYLKKDMPLCEFVK
ncbi:protein FAR1-RELATED SEQUENCE 5-like [Cornus florida]|uniref:protein FAR1-RELATED SEQUENCE 5-like n=1 Tax=Cornus florida TaxID=4283 RepID=UPI00289B8E01|nr:protein FAR1-RELATED SEQUENCE 5-like [Cornus florida]